MKRTQSLSIGILVSLLLVIILLSGCMGKSSTQGSETSANQQASTSIPPSPQGNSDSQYGYNGGVPFGSYTIPQPPPSPIQPDPTGTYRIYSSYIAHRGAVSMPFSENLILSNSGDWYFGTSSGSWHVSPIIDTDWTDWGVSSYGPNYKIVMDNWNGVGASGPIETDSAGTVNFVWIIYNTPQGMEQLKFGH